MLEQPQERGLVAKVARELSVKYRTALNWWHIYEETEGVPYKNSEKNSDNLEGSLFFSIAFRSF